MRRYVKIGAALWIVPAMTACSGSLQVRPEPGVNISGHWILNRAESDNSENVLLSQSKMSSEGDSRAGGDQGGDSPNTPPGGGPPGGGMPPGGGRRGAGSHPLAGRPAGPLNAEILIGTLKWPGDVMDIVQDEDTVRFISSDKIRTYRPQMKPCITLETPLHEHVGASCGWDGLSWVVIIKSKRGLKITETYTVVDGGVRLLQRILIQGVPTGDLELSKTFDGAPPPAPSAPPPEKHPTLLALPTY